MPDIEILTWVPIGIVDLKFLISSTRSFLIMQLISVASTSEAEDVDDVVLPPIKQRTSPSLDS